MRMYTLLETSYKDVLNDKIIELIERYRGMDTKGLYLKGDVSNNQYLIPLKSFINHPMLYQDLLHVNSIQVVATQGRSMNLATLTWGSFRKHAERLGITHPKETLKMVSDLIKPVGDNSTYGHVMFYLLNHRIDKGDVITGSKDYTGLYSKMDRIGFDVIVDTSRNITSAIISNRYRTIGLYRNASLLKVVETINLQQPTMNMVETEEIIRDLAIRISEDVLDTELNTDDPYLEGNDHYYWSFDGMQLRITETYKKTDTTANMMFLLDIETPYGVLYYVTGEKDTFDDIILELSNRYKRMTMPIANWQPKDRDIFLHNEELEFKDNDQRVIDLIQEVRKYYPSMRQFAKRYKIQLAPMETYNMYDKAILNDIIRVFEKQPHARRYIDKITEKGEVTDITKVARYFPRNKLPKSMNVNELTKLAMTYDIAKKNNPNTTGWRVFYAFK